MSKYLIQTTEVYRADTENEVQTLIEEAKSAKEYELAKYSSEKKDIKVKGEGVVGEYYKVSMTKVFNDIKDPITMTAVNYEVY
jgi:hypothetical protein